MCLNWFFSSIQELALKNIYCFSLLTALCIVAKCGNTWAGIPFRWVWPEGCSPSYTWWAPAANTCVVYEAILGVIWNKKHSNPQILWLPYFQHSYFVKICCRFSTVIANLVLAFMFSYVCLYSWPGKQNYHVSGLGVLLVCLLWDGSALINTVMGKRLEGLQEKDAVKWADSWISCSGGK